MFSFRFLIVIDIIINGMYLLTKIASINKNKFRFITQSFMVVEQIIALVLTFRVKKETGRKKTLLIYLFCFAVRVFILLEWVVLFYLNYVKDATFISVVNECVLISLTLYPFFFVSCYTAFSIVVFIPLICGAYANIGGVEVDKDYSPISFLWVSVIPCVSLAFNYAILKSSRVNFLKQRQKEKDQKKLSIFETYHSHLLHSIVHPSFIKPLETILSACFVGKYFANGAIIVSPWIYFFQIIYLIFCLIFQSVLFPLKSKRTFLGFDKSISLMDKEFPQQSFLYTGFLSGL
jgi:hypothetical protein